MKTLRSGLIAAVIASAGCAPPNYIFGSDEDRTLEIEVQVDDMQNFISEDYHANPKKSILYESFLITQHYFKSMGTEYGFPGIHIEPDFSGDVQDDNIKWRLMTYDSFIDMIKADKHLLERAMGPSYAESEIGAAQYTIRTHELINVLEEYEGELGTVAFIGSREIFHFDWHFYDDLAQMDRYRAALAMAYGNDHSLGHILGLKDENSNEPNLMNDNPKELDIILQPLTMDQLRQIYDKFKD